MTSTRMYLSPPHLSGREQEYLAQALASGWVAPAGPHLERFESDFAARLGVRHALAVSSGTAALHLALRCLGLEEGDEVLCSTLTFVASASPIVQERARPVFIDSERLSWNLDPGLVEAELVAAARRGRLPRALIAVDVFGQSADMDPLVGACRRFGVPVIEDAAEALGATYRGRAAGTSGWCGVFSFNGNKIITTSGGGMLVSDDEQLIARARFLATQARDAAPHYQHSRLGFNYRQSNLLAAVGLAQLEVLDQRVAARRNVFQWYNERLADLPGISFMPEASFGRSSRWLTVVEIDPDAFGADREQVRLALEVERIESRPAWKPLHLQPAFDGCRRAGGAVAEGVFERGLCLPSGSAMTVADVDRVVAQVRAVAARGPRAGSQPKRERHAPRAA